ncbi:uncharacterized protein L969DRAFT_86098 [Mixia osmundae IAM 14324]|uniref:uncharacterized protein n=1 Tax=Mixia osmundae (strain CBS 9802 / IAM 14324 / JCM 22182 / KY 12970) TaxID=764103 RepID=UPI0004A54CD0|nr:uncharacterized protein L969DRAFT_86098 [Mixia osmundae IAM 14324]KEI40860.1 hypothetical protein L969DRAFT_86098 [Mixia osmundae IAM 14324]
MALLLASSLARVAACEILPCRTTDETVLCEMYFVPVEVCEQAEGNFDASSWLLWSA